MANSVKDSMGGRLQGSEAVERRHIEDFLILEARLLDTWQLPQWLELLTADARYVIPSTDAPDGKPGEALFLILDDRLRLESRVRQLLSPTAWAEIPRSRTRRLISNVWITEQSAEGIKAEANFAVWRFKNDRSDIYVGKYCHQFVLQDGVLLLRERKAVLDLEVLRPHGKLSFIL